MRVRACVRMRELKLKKKNKEILKVGRAIFRVDITTSGTTEKQEYIRSDLIAPYPSGVPCRFPSITEFAEQLSREITWLDNVVVDDRNGQRFTIQATGGEIFYQEDLTLTKDGDFVSKITYQGTTQTIDRGYSYLLPEYTNIFNNGVCTITYRFYEKQTRAIWTATGYIGFAENKEPLKKSTILDVINRTFDLIIPIKYGQKPKFRLQGTIYDDTTGNCIGYRTGDGDIKITSVEDTATETILNLIKQGEL